MDEQTYTNEEIEAVIRRYAPVSEDIDIAIERMDMALLYIERQVLDLAGLFEQEWLRSGRTDKVSKSIAERLRAAIRESKSGKEPTL